MRGTRVETVINVDLARQLALAVIRTQPRKAMLMTGVQDPSGKSIEDFLTIEEATAMSGYTDQYLRRMAKRGMVRAVKRGHFWLIERASLEAYLQAAQQTDDQRYGPRSLSENE